MKIARHFRPLARLAQEAGWTLDVLGNGHMRWRSPEGRWVYLSTSPGDRRARWKVRAALRRAGLFC